MERGKIHNRARWQQVRDFSGLRFGNITATDIDGLIEYQNKGYIIFELKNGDAPLDFGQRLALERLTDTLTGAGKPTICIISSHMSDNPEQDIDVANSLVVSYRSGGKWHEVVERGFITKELVERFINVKLSQQLPYNNIKSLSREEG